MKVEDHTNMIEVLGRNQLITQLIGDDGSLQYKVELIHSEEGYSISCPELPGCWSKGHTEQGAIDNIKAIGRASSVRVGTIQTDRFDIMMCR